jgi:hypothetical protein
MPLFDVPYTGPTPDMQVCDLCPTAKRASDDGLRASGWLVYNGKSVTGKTLHVRLCPACR